MPGKVTFAFLLTIGTLFEASVALPAAKTDKDFVTLNVKDLENQPPPFIDECKIPCDPCQDDPICATDGKTYGCPNALTCYQMCGKEIKIDYYGNCTHEYTDYTIPNTKTTKSVKKDLSQKPYPFTNACLIRCDTTDNETGLVCGTDGKTYTSVKELLCYQGCGQDTEVAYEGECKRNNTSCKIPCDPCQDDPICASDGQTYGCPNALTCYQMCGKDIKIDYFGNCKDTQAKYTVNQ